MSSRGGRRAPLALPPLLVFSLGYLVLIGVAGWLVFRSLEEVITDRALDHLETTARVSALGMPSAPDELGEWVETNSEASGYRYTVVDRDGVVLADSHADPATMENHADRPEIAAALSGGVGRSARLSETTGFRQLYVGLPSNDAVLRLSGSTRQLAADASPYRSAIVLVAGLVGVLGLGVIGWLSRWLATPLRRLSEETLALAGGHESRSPIRSGVREIDQLSSAISQLHDESRGRLQTAEQSSETLEVVLGALPQGTLLFDEDDRVSYANPSAYQLLGAVPDSLAALVPFTLQTAVDECRLSRSPVSVDAEHGKPVRILRGIATPFSEDRRVLLVVVDVTERERAASVRRDFVANASHELKTPVASIIASAEALQMAVERGDPSASRFAERIEGSARHLDRLVADLLDLSRLERDRPELETLDLEPLVREEVERAKPTAEERGIVLTADLAPVTIAGSRRDLAIAFRNLLDNALAHTRPGGSITVRLKPDAEALLQVTDTGEGIPTRDLGRVFERFYRVDESRARSTGGTGLGLAIVKHVVESHGGSVEAESELGAGSTFTVRLPLLAEQTPAAH